MNILMCIIKKDDLKIIINESWNVINGFPEDLHDNHDYSEFLNLKVEKENSMHLKIINSVSHKIEISDIKEIYIKKIEVVKIKKDRIKMFLDLRHIFISSDKNSLEKIFKELPCNFVKCGNAKFDIHKAIRKSIKISKKLHHFSYEDQYTVSFTPKNTKDSIDKIHDRYYDGSKEEAEYILNYYKIQNKKKLIESCK